MKNLFDHHTAHRIAALRKMQGLPFDIPPGHTVYRQSDFEKSKVWRYVIRCGLVVIIAVLFEPAPGSPQNASPAAGHAARLPVHASV
ncbi:hypothetical protein [Caballeronia sp. dw_19]|uniref:hypothetical protein n=1 Tax=Caballeronia sp. dw_19 TaxID=2719791 RepID=UPI001BD3D844|nr:hypothetical protein [Caballeronia sp. dw_19]